MDPSQEPGPAPKEFICRNCPHSVPKDASTIFCKIREHVIPASAPCCGFSLIPWDSIPWIELPWTRLGAKYKLEQNKNPKRKLV